MKQFKTPLFTFLMILIAMGTMAGNNIDAEDILDDIEDGDAIFIHDKTIEGKLDFTLIEGQPVAIGQFAHIIKAPVCFVGCHFTDDVLAFRQEEKMIHFSIFDYGITFQECSFDSTFKLKGSIIKGPLALNGSLFSNTFSMEGTDIYGNEAVFNQCSFGGEVKCQRLRFRGNADFFKAKFLDIASFQNARFDGEARFNVCSFEDNVDFSLIKSFDFYMNYTTFTGKFLFQSAYIQNRLEFVKTGFHEAALLNSIKVMGESKFHEVKVYSKIELSGGYYLMGSPLAGNFIKENEDAEINF